MIGQLHVMDFEIVHDASSNISLQLHCLPLSLTYVIDLSENFPCEQNNEFLGEPEIP